MTPTPPAVPRASTFIDGQNLFYAAKEAFGYSYPNYDPLCLSRTVCQAQGWNLSGTRFYTGVPDVQDDAFWHHFWTAKLAQMGRRGVTIFSRSLRYRNQTVYLPDGSKHTFLVGQEKGVDVRLALDIVRLVREDSYDVCLIFSQDQDLTEAVEEVKLAARKHDRWIKVACAFPSSPTSRNKRGIDKTDWIRIDRATYDSCLDHRDYRPKKAP
ncbi:MAG: NYN domain-containing protein [Candidatus Methylomirabilales bacterium]